MHFAFLEKWVTDDTLRTICRVLMHSLWEGVLAAIIAGLIIAGTRKSSASLRYNLLGAVTLLFLAGVAVTFYLQPGAVTSASAIPDIASARSPAGTVTILPRIKESLLDNALFLLDRYAPFVVTAWLLFFAWKCIKLFSGLAGINRIRRQNVSAPPEEWVKKLGELADRLHLRQRVQLMHSERIGVPVTVGFFRPLIFVPLGLLTHLPPSQAETILLHELAHIRRKDYAVNLLQRFVEAVFFFNPGILWISSLLRQEREACCDDIVVAHTPHREIYLEALIFFQEQQLGRSGYAMAIGTKRNYLLSRVKRMLTRENEKLKAMEKLLLFTGLVVMTAFRFIPSSAAAAQEKPFVVLAAEAAKDNAVVAVQEPIAPQKKKNARVHRENMADTVPSPKENGQYEDLKISGLSSDVNDDGKSRKETTTVTDDKGKKYVITKLDHKITSLTIDGRTIPENEMADHAGLFRQIETATQERHEQKEKLINERKEIVKARQVELKQPQELLKEKHGQLEENELVRANENIRRESDMSRKMQQEKRERSDENGQSEVQEKRRHESDLSRKMQQEKMKQFNKDRQLAERDMNREERKMQLEKEKQQAESDNQMPRKENRQLYKKKQREYKKARLENKKDYESQQKQDDKSLLQYKKELLRKRVDPVAAGYAETGQAGFV